ncbi:MAG: hypothetical protein COS17_02310 [Elusimicrobia bacterium CG02_land_8_20_14_3_00_37_13]|nr:MAG: hypothetical protein COS17_02310 [Elusimicrobia bacterium CG02_land_8_20_14_3_00_37_13]
MGYKLALNKVWQNVIQVTEEKTYEVRFVNDIYIVDIRDGQVLDKLTDKPAKDYISVLLLYYLEKKIKGLPSLTGEWISFKQLDGGDTYYSAFHKRAIEPLIRKYGNNPESLNSLLNKFPSHKLEYGDAGIVIDVFDGISLLFTVWRGDEEISPGVNILYDKNISEIFSTESVAVLSQILAYFMIE